MLNEKEILQTLRISLDQEEDETSVISILESHHKYLRAFVAILNQHYSTITEKQVTAKLLFTIFEMNAKAEEHTLYRTLKTAKNHNVRLECLRNYEEHLVAHKIISELHDIIYQNFWSEQIEAKMNLLTRIISSHIDSENKVMFRLSDKYLSEEELMDLADDYLEYCRAYLDGKINYLPSNLSRSEVLKYVF